MQKGMQEPPFFHISFSLQILNDCQCLLLVFAVSVVLVAEQKNVVSVL